MKNEIIIFGEENIKLEVNVNDETVWLTQSQMAKLFDKDENTINEHINNIFKEKELDKESSTGISGKSIGGRPPKTYNLDVIISVGYRVKSKRGTQFRIWANKVLKEYLLKGYAVNDKRLEYLGKVIEIASRIDKDLIDEETDILNVINEYSKGLTLLDKYDHKSLDKPKNITKDKRQITYDECISIIDTMRLKEESKLFALERDKGLESIINNIYQSFDNKDVYVGVEEKVANFLYLCVKDHVFIDGNKRIAATLFIYFLNFYNILNKNNNRVIDNNTLVALTLMIAESNPKEKDIIVNLVLNLLDM